MSIPDVFLPTLFSVVRRAYISGATNNSGNSVDSWGPPTEHLVYGWGPPESKKQFTEAVQVYAEGQRFMVEVSLMVPPGFVGKSRDRFILGPTLAQYQATPDAFDVYRQVGPIQSYEANPFGWNPGSEIYLVAAEGAK